jgi:hypothetical protein
MRLPVVAELGRYTELAVQVLEEGQLLGTSHNRTTYLSLCCTFFCSTCWRSSADYGMQLLLQSGVVKLARESVRVGAVARLPDR